MYDIISSNEEFRLIIMSLSHNLLKKETFGE
mgnify:CR=1 FL=1|jgi:hypothetical protein